MVDGGSVIAFVRGLEVADVVGLAGFVLALAGIALTFGQLILLRRQLRLDALIRIIDSNRELVCLGIQHPAVLSALDEAPSSDTGELSAAQRRYLQLWINHLQLVWTLRTAGLVNRYEWEAYRLDMAACLRIGRFREHWRRVVCFYPKGFRGLVAELQASAEGAFDAPPMLTPRPQSQAATPPLPRDVAGEK